MALNDIIVAKEGSGGVLAEIALAPADIGAAPASHTHAAADITSGTLNINRVMQQVSIESIGTELSPDVLDLTSYIVGGNLHALAIILSAVPNAYTEVVLPDLGAGALGVVTVRPNYFEDPSANFLKVTNGTNNIWPAPPSTFIEMDDNEEVTFRWNQGKWDMDIRPNPAATAVPVQIFKPNTSGTLGLSEPSDSTFRIVGSSDATKKVAFEVDGLSSGTTRTLTVPNASGTLALTSDIPSCGSKTYAVFTATDNQPTATAFMTLDTRNSISVLDADDASTESAVFVGILPEAAALGSGLIVSLRWMATTATSGDVRWSVAWEKSNTDLDSDSFDTATAATATTNGTSGIVTVTNITCTNIDSLAAGDLFRLRVQRVGGDGADTMTGDAELVVCEVRSAA